MTHAYFSKRVLVSRALIHRERFDFVKEGGGADFSRRRYFQNQFEKQLSSRSIHKIAFKFFQLFDLNDGELFDSHHELSELL